MEIMKVLAIGAHPDDIEIFMLGFLMSCKSRKDEIFMGIATDGAAGDIIDYSDLSQVRKKETLSALKFIGKPHFFNFPDGELSIAQNSIKIIKDYITSIKPDLIVTHAPEDYHSDHRALSHFVHQATGFICPILYSDTLMGINFNPDYYVDITPFFKIKSKAILKHRSQKPRNFLEATSLLNRFRSAQCNAPNGNYAEAFRFESKFPFADIRSLLPPSPDINPFYKSSSKSMI